jgi:beta-mannosidase
MRKAQYGYGWDWGPRLPTIGIWRPVELRRERRAAITGVAFATLAIGRDALVSVRVEADAFAARGELTADVELGMLARASVTLRDGVGTAYLALDDPPLWWTHDLGEPVLHDLRVVLRDDGEEVAADERRVGVRTIELDQSPDPGEPGTRFFRFVLNGQPIFARGGNWIPAESFPGAVEQERYDRLLGAAVGANMNMVRVWGGGIYESDAFYAGCDERGLLVWQDFMFACATYPEEPLAEEVDLEARAQVARLRSHPCLALFYDEILPRAVAEVDGRTPYWPGSPFGGNDHNDRAQGNVHNWEVWHGQSRRRFGEPSAHDISPATVRFDRYAEDEGRFISEFGVLAAPDRETLRRWIPADQLFHHSPSMDHHTKDTPKNKVDMLLESVTGVAGDLDEFVDFSMIAQAEALKFGLEHFRRRKPHCSGTLIWQLNDCWPVLSWALVDYHGFGKAGYFFVRRAYAPVLASFRVADDGAAELWVTNDTAAAVRDEAAVVGTFAGEALTAEEVAFEVPAHASRLVHRTAVEGAPDRYATVRGAAFPPNRHFFAAIKDLDRAPGELEHSFEDGAVRLRAKTYAYFVHLSCPDEDARFEERTVAVSGADDLTVRSR